MNRTLVVLIILMTCGCSTKTSESNGVAEVFPERYSQEAYHAAFLIMDGTFNSELTAPFDMFQHTRYRNVDKPIHPFTISQYGGEITTFEGLRILADRSFSDSLPQIDILVIPAAKHHLDSDLENGELIHFIRNTGIRAKYVLSLCDGAFPLAESGLLGGLNCTTFPTDRQALRDRYPDIKQVHDSVLWVHDKKFITSAGGAKSFEPAQYMIELLYGKDVADENGKGMVIDWNKEDYPHVVIPSTTD